MGLLTRCEQCGRFHGAEEKCRPKWGRRGFLAMLGAIPAMAATGLPAWADPPPGKGDWLISLDYISSTALTAHLRYRVGNTVYHTQKLLPVQGLCKKRTIELVPAPGPGKRIEDLTLTVFGSASEKFTLWNLDSEKAPQRWVGGAQ